MPGNWDTMRAGPQVRGPQLLAAQLLILISLGLSPLGLSPFSLSSMGCGHLHIPVGHSRNHRDRDRLSSDE